jgi:hypothetical protein
MRFATSLLAGLLLLPSLGRAQAPASAPPVGLTSVRGRLVDPTTRQGVPAALVKMTDVADTTKVKKTITRDDGSFEIADLGVSRYRLEASRLGYARLNQVVQVHVLNQNLGLLMMTPQAVNIPGITVTESPAPAVQIEDTTEYRASAVKTEKDATAEDLVQKMPGLIIEKGKLKAHGEDVKQVLINGKPFFGSDPTAALRNLPAEVVDRIQVYDKASDQAEFSGFDDDGQQKTLNFILRDRKAQFGKVTAGYGDRDRYEAGGNYTRMWGDTRLTLIGISNNINQRNFAAMDLFGALPQNGGSGRHGSGGSNGQPLSRTGGGGFGGSFDASSFYVNQEGGISTTNSVGANYVSQWGPKLAVSASLFLNDIDNRNTNALTRDYLPPQNSIDSYDQLRISDNNNGNARFDARFEWTPDSLNSVIMVPKLYFQDNHANSSGIASNRTIFGSEVSSSVSSNEHITRGDNLSNRLTLRHRFGKRGRTLSADFQMGHTSHERNRNQQSLNRYTDPESLATIDQTAGSSSGTNSLESRFAYTEPLGAAWQGQLMYNPSITHSSSDARTFAFDSLTGAYSTLEPIQSNSFANEHHVQSGGAALQYKRGSWHWLTQASYKATLLQSDQSFPSPGFVSHRFYDWLPSMTLTGTFANKRSVRLHWSTSTGVPHISQLQPVVENTNPLSLTAGNPGLRETYTNTITLRVSEADASKSRSRFLFANVVHTSNPISNYTYTAKTDTVVSGIPLARGTQLTRPVNLDASWTANLFAAYSWPARWMRSIFTLNGGGAFDQTPTKLNHGINRNRTTIARFGATIASNISTDFDFTLSYQGNYNISRNTLSTNTTGDYYAHTLTLRLTTVMLSGIVMRQEVSNEFQNNASTVFGQSQTLWNTTLGRKFFKDDKGELRFTITDVLHQDRSVGRSITPTYVQDSRDLALGSFMQAVFTYSFR